MISNSFLLQVLVVMFAYLTLAEPPIGRRPNNAYLPPLSSHHHQHSHHGNGFLSAGSGSGYRAIGGGFQENEGQHLDSQLLRKIEEILLVQENQSQGGSSGHGLGFSAPSSSYGAPSNAYLPPSNSYLPPSHHQRVVGIELGNIQSGIQVAQFHQQSSVPIAPSSSYGVPIGPSPAPVYRAPSASYSAPLSIPSSTYGVPSTSIISPSITALSYSVPSVASIPSSSYGVPSISLSAPSATYSVPSLALPQNSYLPPPRPNNSYLPPSQPRPHSSYSAPISYFAPSNSYLPPQRAYHPQPSNSYLP